MNEDTNLVVNPSFRGGPDSWGFISPRPELAPGHSVISGSECRLVLSSNGDKYAFGCWQGTAELAAGEWYRASVKVRVRGIENPELSVFAQVAQHFLLPKGEWGDEILLEQVFRHNEGDGNAVEFYLRAADVGEVEWFNPQVVRIPEPVHRMARVATVRFGEPRGKLTMTDQWGRIGEKLDEAGALSADIVCLPEFCPIVGVTQDEYGSYAAASEEAPDGPVCRILSEKAREHGMYVLSGIIERCGDYVFNTAVLFDRQGGFAGRYRKTHLTFGELKEGISCGEDYPVFDLDFGRIAVHICYDEWFPEVARLLAHKGAEILFLPVAGGKPITWRTRALDNGMYFVSSSINPPSMIIDSSGVILAETHGDGIAYADLNLDYRKVNWYGDPTLSYGMPCTVPQMRNVLDDRLFEELGRIFSKPR